MKRVLSIGQCAADGPMIAQMLRSHCGAETIHAAMEAAALTVLRGQAVNLVLINRILDADGASGMDILRRLKADEVLCAVPVMLVSNYDDAQQQAIAAGALPGFGKAALNTPESLARLKTVLG